MHLFYIEHYLFNKQNGYADGIMDKDSPAMLPLAPLPFNLSDVRNAVPASALVMHELFRTRDGIPRW